MIFNTSMAIPISPPNYISQSSDALPILVYTDKVYARIQRSNCKNSYNSYTITLFDLNNKNYIKTREYTFQSEAYYTKVWLTNRYLLLTNNCSTQKVPYIAIIELSSKLMGTEHTPCFELNQYDILGEGLTIRQSTFDGPVVIKPIQWHYYELNLCDNVARIQLGHNYNSKSNNKKIRWEYSPRERIGGFFYENKDMPSNVKTIKFEKINSK